MCPFLKHRGCRAGVVVLLFIAVLFLMTGIVQAADDTYEGFLGDTITLHGVSYIGDKVYLFLTGPGLPVNGVTLTDVNQRADQGHFTVVDLDSSQAWSYTWKTSGIEAEIDPGTYTVYVTNEPVDLANLGGSSSYQTLTVYLRDSGVSRVSINAGSAYTLKPEIHSSTVTSTRSPVVTSPVITITSAPQTTDQIPSLPLPAPTARARLDPVTVLLSLGVCGSLLIFSRHKK